jgi:hypothetical protein
MHSGGWLHVRTGPRFAKWTRAETDSVRVS